MKKRVIAISGIDTNIGKTVATGAMANSLLTQGYRVFTQKVVQTGCTGKSEDIAVHRQMMGINRTEEDRAGVSCPYIFAQPCSPHLAAKMAGEYIDSATIARATERLLQRYDIVLLEGAGGLSVPLTLEYTFVDYLEEHKIPVVLVSSPRLGSINHTLNAVEILHSRQIQLAAVFYNLHGFMVENKDRDVTAAMVADSREVILHYLQKLRIDAEVIDFSSPPQQNRAFHQALDRMVLRL